MRICNALLTVAALTLGCWTATAQQEAPSAPGRIVARIDAQQTAAPVSKYLFGMFTEHIGNLMYRSIWAEMVDDRKFYFAIDSKEPKAEAHADAGPFRDMAPHKWRPIGPDEAVTMDKNKPFVGDQSPRIALDAVTPHGIRQAEMGVVKGKKYTGRIVVKGTPGARVKVALVWGEGEKDRQVVSLGPLTAGYKTVPFSFTAQADSAKASLEISGTGTGSFHIGTVSLMPADNIDGFRADTIPLLKQLNSGFWRWGGNYTSNFTWYNAIGDRDRRPPDYDFAWNAVQSNDLGPDEFLKLCKLIGVEPYVGVNAGLGDAHSAAEEVEYTNGSVQTRLGAERARNGHPEPYHVKFWNIGNEPWGVWQIGRTDLKYYLMKHNDFAKAMRKADPSIVLLASGLILEDGNIPGELRAKNVGNLEPLFGGDADWDGGFLKSCWGNFDGITEHWYAGPGKRFDLEKAKSLASSAPSDDAYVKVDQTALQKARYPADIVRVKAEEWQGYQKRFPAMLDKKTFLSIDEYAYFGDFSKRTDLESALTYGMIFNEMLRHTDFLTMGAFTSGVSTLDINKTSATLNTVGLVFDLYSNHLGKLPVAVAGNSPQPAPKFSPAPDQPKVSSGSPTYPLDVFAALTADHKFLTVSVVNATDSEQKLDLELSGLKLAGQSTLWQITGASLDASNHVGQPAQVAEKEIQLGDAAKTLSVAPISVNIYRLAVKE